jgi:hypothetical protein
MEPWLTDSIDYYSWVFGAGYWIGDGDPLYFGMSTNYYGYDEYGSHIIYAMFSAVRFELPVISISGYTVFLLSTIGVGVYTLIRKIFGFKPILAFIAALGLVGGNFFNFLCISGIYGQLVATIGYTGALIVIFNESREEFGRKFFFPLFFIFMTYQAAYVVYALVLLLALFANDFFEKSKESLFNIKRITSIIKNNLKVLCGCVVAGIVVCPEIAVQMVMRTISAATQKDGYGLRLLDPILFSGIPSVIDMARITGTSTTSYLSYAVFLPIIFLLLWICLKFRNQDISYQQFNSKIKASFSLYIICYFVYLAAYIILGNLYQVWKFVSYMSLPLAFIPFCLLFCAIKYVTRRGRASFILLSAVSIIVISIVPLLKVLSPGYLDRRGNNLRSLTPMISTFLMVHDYDKNVPRVIFDLYDMKRDYAAAAISQHLRKEMGFLEDLYFIPRVRDYFKFFTKDAVIYSDRSYEGLYNGVANPLPPMFTIYRYTYDDVRMMGAAKYSGFDEFSRKVLHEYLNVSVIMPRRFIGKDSTLRVYIDKRDFYQKSLCQKFDFIPIVKGEHIAIEGDIKDFSILIPKEWVTNGYLNFNLHFPGIFTTTRYNNFLVDDKSECSFRLLGVEITEAQSDVKLNYEDSSSNQTYDRQNKYSDKEENQLDDISNNQVSDERNLGKPQEREEIGETFESS